MSWWHHLTTYYHCSLILMTSYVFSRPQWIGHLGLIRSSVSHCHAIGKYWYPELKCSIMITMTYNFSKTFERPIYIIESSVKVMNKYLSMGSELYILLSTRYLHCGETPIKKYRVIKSLEYEDRRDISFPLKQKKKCLSTSNNLYVIATVLTLHMVFFF